jgi:macrolide transport system ATP-binding/permease protein
MNKPLLSVSGLVRSYGNGGSKVDVLKGISLKIYPGEMVAIIGQSGSGKSTLMNILGCLDRPTGGDYRINGISTKSLSNDDLAALRRNYFGFIFQRYHLLTHLSAKDNVEIPAIYAGTSSKNRDEQAKKLLTRLGLGERIDYMPGQLSGGQQQRVSIARALMNGGKVILADEPTGALDSKSGLEVMKILKELNSQGHTVIIVTHDRSIAANAPHIIEIKDGEIVGDVWNKDKFFTREQEQAYSDSAADSAGEGGAGEEPDGETGNTGKMISDLDRSLTGRTAFFAGLGRFGEAFKMAWIAMVSHRMRTLLTMLGIIIGIAAVVSIVAIGQGATEEIINNINSIGTNTIRIMPGKDWGDMRAGKIKTLSTNDMEALKQQVYTDSVTPSVTSSQILRYNRAEANGQIMGVSSEYFRVMGLSFASGSTFTEKQVKGIAQVSVIDDNTRQKFFNGIDPIGKVILLGKVPTVIIGVLKHDDGGFGASDNLTVYIPYTSAQTRITGARYLSTIILRVRDGMSSAVAEKSIVSFLTKRHGAKDVFTRSSDTIVKTISKTFGTMTLLVSAIAVISLIVGGIGVMNIMLVSVTERTKEIGIRMAVGARKSDILQQFLIEAILVCLFGGILGIILSFGIGVVFSMLSASMRMIFSVVSIVLAVTCSTLIGVIFGYLPAKNAAKLDPIVALARE